MDAYTILRFITLCIALAIYWDASKHKIGKDKENKSFVNISAGAWGVVTILLAIISVPAYLITRKSLIERAKTKPVESSFKSYGAILLIATGLGVYYFIDHG